jgi:AcrR family transcriptional regulator
MNQKKEILKAAAVEFQKQGLKFTMNDVAVRLHISKKTIYTMYSSKEELLTAMLDDGFAGIQKRKQSVLQEDIPLRQKIRKIMIVLPDEYKLIDFRQFSSINEKYPEVYKRLQYHLEHNWKPVIELLCDGMENGSIRRISIPALKQMVASTIESFLTEDILKKNSMSYEEGLNAMMDIIMDGISAGGSVNEDH